MKYELFIKTRILDIDKGKLYNRLFNIRQEGDYTDFQIYDATDIEPYINQVKSFIEDVKGLL